MDSDFTLLSLYLTSFLLHFLGKVVMKSGQIDCAVILQTVSGKRNQSQLQNVEVVLA